MTLYVDIKVGRNDIASMAVTNLGHPEHGDHPFDDDLRRYSYGLFRHTGSTRTGTPEAKGHVEHRRGDGAFELIRRVLNDAAQQQAIHPREQWSHFISSVEDDLVWITDGLHYLAFDRSFMEERYGADTIVEGRMCVRVGEEWAWRCTRWLPEEISDIERRAAELGARLTGGRDAPDAG